MSESVPVWSPEIRDQVVTLLSWLTDGFHPTLSMGKQGKLTRWFVWHVEFAGASPLWGMLGHDLIGREHVQRIGRPDKGGVEFAVARLAMAFDREGVMWGIGAARDVGGVARLTLGIPAAWHVGGDPAHPTVPGKIIWQTGTAVVRELWGCLSDV